MKNNIIKTIIALTAFASPLTVFASTKKETVFSNLNTNGTIYDTTVTNYICPSSKEVYDDNTRLEEIVNLSGDETFEKDGTKITWKVKGKDIYYQGKANEESPIDINIKYYLDGNELSSDEIKGKKGKVSIKMNFTNKMKNRVRVNGKYETLYTPFVIMAGTIMDTKNNKNISASNGRVINTGDKNIVASIASPGLYESLSLDELNKLDEIEFTFDTTDFKMDNIYIIATPKLLDEKDTKLFKDLNKVTDSIKILQDSMNQIESGSTKLKNGTSDLLKGSELIKSKLPSEESNKANETKLNYLKSQNNNTITKLKNANKELETQLTTVETKIKKTKETKESVENKYTQAKNLYAQYEDKHNSLSNIPAEATDEQISALTNGTITTRTELQSTLQTFTLMKNQKDALAGTLEAIKGTLQLLESTKESLNKSIEANKGLIELISGNNQVVDSSISTIDSMRTLTNAMNSLNNGIKKLNDGADTLYKGINKFNNQGIKKLSAYSNQVNNYSSKAEALVNLSKNYKGYASDNSNETIFVNKVQSIK